MRHHKPKNFLFSSFLQKTTSYICDYKGNVICQSGWRQPTDPEESVRNPCSDPICHHSGIKSMKIIKSKAYAIFFCSVVRSYVGVTKILTLIQIIFQPLHQCFSPAVLSFVERLVFSRRSEYLSLVRILSEQQMASEFLKNP